LSDDVGTPGVGRVTRTARRLGFGSLMSSLLFGSRFVTIWLATGLLLVVCRIVAPETLSAPSWSSLLPLGSVVAVVALGQMLVIMMGGIDLSMAGSISLLANVVVGVSTGSNDRMAYAFVMVFVWAVVIGLVNGMLVAFLNLNPLIVTLSTGLVLLGITAEYRLSIANNSSVPDSLSNVVFERVFGLSKTFWFVLVLTVLISLVLRSTAAGRRFQAVGANRRAAWMAGIRVRMYVVFAYIAAAFAAGLAGILIGGILVSPGVDPGAAYLLGPVAAVVLGGAALSGGLASPMSTWVAAFFVTILNQMLKVLGYSNASQFVVFGAAIVLGMVISGDRIADVVGRLLLRPSVQALVSDAPPLAAASSAPSAAAPDRPTVGSSRGVERE
jgi:ribose/xylose/arabinose/galactoside ABC-type transport system permease subunit